ncbi:hypothetical protein H0H92_007617 [Tricholoma furcatifolium]|nr:hypothetical protein H0H92_007617 [Tricholoma furcatifolium]
MHKRAVLTCTPRRDAQVFASVPRRSKHSQASQSHQRPATTFDRQPKRRNEYQDAKITTTKIIERFASAPPNWKETHSLRGKEMKLAALVKHAGQRKSLEQQTFESQGEAESLDDGYDQFSPVLPPATFIETRRNFTVTHGVVLGEYLVGKRRKMVILVDTGEVWFPGRNDVVFAFPNFIPEELALRCGIEIIAPNPTAANARIEVCRRLADLAHTTEVMYNIVNQRGGDIYDEVKSPDPNAWSSTTLSKIMPLVSKKNDDIIRFALHKYLLTDSLHFVAHQQYEATQTINVRPQSHVDDINTITMWMRQTDGPIKSFALKAHKIIPTQQRIEQESRAELPSYTPATHTWTDTDRTILRFLQNSLRSTRSNQTDPYSLGLSHILKQIYPDQSVKLDEDVSRTLINLGVMAPWQDISSLDPVVGLDTEPEPTSSFIKERRALVEKGISAIASSGTKTPLGPEDFHRTDPLDSVRHDFGDLPVFVIDSATAHELDDGISIESVPSEPGTFWIHAHIADPASLIPPTHVLAKEAFNRANTVYFTHRSWPLFPEALMSHPVHGLSLGRNLDKAPMKVLTFSSKINEQGELVEHKVRAGIIRNVKIVSYDQADTALEGLVHPYRYPFGRLIPPKVMPTLPDAHAKAIQDLKLVTDRVITKRVRDGVIQHSHPMAELIPVVQPPSDLYGFLKEPMIFRGFPTSEYSVSSTADECTGSHSIVAEVAKLACRVASRFCLERNIPIMRRFSEQEGSGFSGDIQEILDARDERGYVPIQLVLARAITSGTAGYSMEPKSHIAVSAAAGEGYTRATSPLRRYMDLVAHWQIHHALLGSAAPKATPPFNADEVWEIAKDVSAKDRITAVAERLHLRLALITFLKRWKEDPSKDQSPFKNLTAYSASIIAPNARTGTLQVEVEIPRLGVLATLQNLPSTEAFAVGAEVPIEITEMVLGTRPQITGILRQ